MAKKQVPNIVINDLKLYQLRRVKQDIADWQSAIRSAESVTRPRRLRLLELYQNILSDAFLFSLINKRTLACLSDPILFLNDDRSVNDEVSELLQQTWFSHIVQWISESIYYGFSLIELNPKTQTFHLIPRAHVLPEQSKILFYPLGEDGIDYTKPPYNQYMLFVGNPKNLGLLMQACPIVLYKRGSLADWATFCEIFGMPIREYTYNPNNPQAKLEAERAAKEAGAAAYIVTPEGSQLKLHNGINGTGNDVYERFRLAMNEELSILILGQSMTTTNGSSRSQAEVHERQQELIIKSDRNYIENTLNEVVLPLLQAHGIINAKGYFAYESKERITIDDIVKLGNLYKIPASYISDRFGIEIEAEAQPTSNKQQRLAIKKKVRTLALTKTQKERILSGKYEELLPYFAEAFYKEVSENLSIDFSNRNEYKIRTGLQANAFDFASARYEYLKSRLAALDPDSRKVEMAKFEGYLEVEKEHFAASAQMARQWLDFEANADEFPLLKYVTAQDDHVRPNHKALNGVTLPITDSFWATHTPPLGYRCRCTMQQLRADAPTTPKDQIPQVNPDKPLFANNAGISGKAFIDQHTYFQDTNKATVSKLARKEIREYVRLWAKDNLVGKKITVEQIGTEVDFTYSGIKEATDQNHDSYNIKNLSIINIERLLKEAKYIKFLEDKKKRTNIIGFHYLKYADNIFIVLMEKINNEILFYSIVDKIK